MKDGEHKHYREDGTLSVHCHHLNGKRHGDYKDYRDDGTLWEHCYYVNDKRHGEYKYYYKDGSLWEHFYFVNGKELVDLLKEPCDDVALFELQIIHGGQLL